MQAETTTQAKVSNEKNDSHGTTGDPSKLVLQKGSLSFAEKRGVEIYSPTWTNVLE